MKTPKYFQNQNALSRLLSPISAVYAALTALRLKTTKPYHASIPVVCVGNIMAGGVGKTPVSIALAKLLIKSGKNPFFISRGYGGSLSGVLVDTKAHTARDVGDEPLILACTAPTVVCKDRAKAAKIAEENGADVLIMDDGFQNPTLKKDVSFLVFSGETGIGNGKILPAGPLRESLKSGLKRADGVLLVEEDKTNLLEKIDKPCFEVYIKEENPQNITSKVLAFAGIGYPMKFYNSLIKCGLTIAKTYDFEDHHFYSRTELEALIGEAQQKDLALFTTMKDFVKIPTDLQPHFNVLNINAEFKNKKTLLDFISSKGVC